MAVAEKFQYLRFYKSLKYLIKAAEQTYGSGL